MTSLILRPGLAFCLIDDVAVFLDLDEDRYFQIDEAATSKFLEALQGTDGHADAQALVSARLLVPSGSAPAISPASIGKAVQELEIGDAVRASTGWVLVALVFLVLARIKQRGSPARLLREGLRLDWLPPVHPHIPEEHIGRIVRSFVLARRLLPMSANCVVRSHALRRLLLACGVLSRVVIGVKGKPFAAHCWLEYGDRLVGDKLDYVDPFTPLAVAP